MLNPYIKHLNKEFVTQNCGLTREFLYKDLKKAAVKQIELDIINLQKNIDCLKAIKNELKYQIQEEKFHIKCEKVNIEKIKIELRERNND